MYIRQFNYNGTIIDVRGTRILVLPHNYGYPDLFHPSLLESGTGINCYQRVRLEELGYYHLNQLLLDTDTHSVPHQRFQIVR